MPAFSFEYSRLRVGPRSVNHLNVCFNMHQPIRLLVCSKLGKHIDVPSNRDGVAHVILCFADLVPAVCREAAMRKLCFANKYRAVTTLILPRQRQSWRHAPRHSHVSETSLVCAPWLSHMYFGLPNRDLNQIEDLDPTEQFSNILLVLLNSVFFLLSF